MVMVYDDRCGFCDRTVQWMLRRDGTGSLRFAPREGTFGAALLARHPHLIDVDSMIWVDQLGDGMEEVHTRSDAVLRIANYLGGAWKLAAVARLVPAPLRDFGYRLVARHRHRLSRDGARCVVPEPAQLERFLP